MQERTEKGKKYKENKAEEDQGAGEEQMKEKAEKKIDHLGKKKADCLE